MSNSKHTPGPWQLAQDGSLGSIETVSGQVPIGHSFQTRPTRRPEDHIERIANARLIAAAPELLEALRIAREFMSIASDWNFHEAEINGEMRSTYDWLEVVDAAIAKATGDTE